MTRIPFEEARAHLVGSFSKEQVFLESARVRSCICKALFPSNSIGKKIANNNVWCHFSHFSFFLEKEKISQVEIFYTIYDNTTMFQAFTMCLE